VKCVRAVEPSSRSEHIFYVACDDEASLHVVDPMTGHDRKVTTLEKLQGGFTVSPTTGAILYTRHVSDANDLMLIENFR
jgi:hypothetical protein